MIKEYCKMEFQIPMQPFVSRENGRIKRRKSGKLSPREGEREEERKKRGLPKGGGGVSGIIYSNYKCEKAASRVPRMSGYLKKPGKEENEEWEFRKKER